MLAPLSFSHTLTLAHSPPSNDTQIQGSDCVQNMDGKFSHALWMSSRTASTLGFDEIRPNPDCPFTNFTVMLEVRKGGSGGGGWCGVFVYGVRGAPHRGVGAGYDSW